MVLKKSYNHSLTSFNPKLHLKRSQDIAKCLKEVSRESRKVSIRICEGKKMFEENVRNRHWIAHKRVTTILDEQRKQRTFKNKHYCTKVREKVFRKEVAIFNKENSYEETETIPKVGQY